MEELQELVEAAKHAVPGVDAAIAAAINRKLKPVSHLYMLLALLAVAPSVHCSSQCSLNAFLSCLSFSTAQLQTAMC